MRSTPVINGLTFAKKLMIFTLIYRFLAETYRFCEANKKIEFFSPIIITDWQIDKLQKFISYESGKQIKIINLIQPCNEAG